MLMLSADSSDFMVLRAVAFESLRVLLFCSRVTFWPFWATMALISEVVSTPVLMPLMEVDEVDDVVAMAYLEVAES
jgi:hypothetical protein